MSDLGLDINVKQRAFEIRARRIQHGTGQMSVSGKCTIHLIVLAINLEQGTTTNVTEVALNQAIVVGRYTTTWWWLPENSVDVRCTGHDRATVVRDVGADAGCFRRLSVAPAVKDMHLMGLGSSGRCCRKAGCRHQRYYYE